jgi:hypothetical protein
MIVKEKQFSISTDPPPKVRVGEYAKNNRGLSPIFPRVTDFPDFRACQ